MMQETDSASIVTSDNQSQRSGCDPVATTQPVEAVDVGNAHVVAENAEAKRTEQARVKMEMAEAEATKQREAEVAER